VSYTPDLFGSQRRSVEALRAAADAQRYGVLAAYLALTANVVNTGVARCAYQAQREALLEIVRMQADQIRIAEVQFEAGTAAYTAVVALKSQQAANQAAVAALEQRIDQSAHLLAQLGGRAPDDAPLPAIRLADLNVPADLPDTLPSALARHRPDILAAEAELHRASAQIGVATADLFPTLTLGGSLGASHAAIADVLKSGITFWSAQAQLAATAFSGFGQWYARRSAIDAYDRALADYQQAVLAGLTQVADAVTALGHDAQALRAQAASQDAAAEGLKLARANYEAGTAGYLDLLNADSQYQQARLAYVGAVAQRLQDTVALYAALGGGWWNRDGG
jgi:NodT family efflux transporter outer membrane factor (OMF) lipoprotein